MLNKNQFQKNLLKWFDENKRDLPWRKNRTPYRIWISEIMLQQTQVATVIPYFKRWLKEFPTIKSLSNARIDKVLRIWEGLGYYSRARNLKKGAEYITKNLKGKFPRTRDELIKVPGIGPYTAGAITSIAFGLKEPLVDGNVGRVFARVFEIAGVWSEPKTNKELWKRAAELLPAKRTGDFNEALMELGAMVCLKDHPACLVCPISDYCQAYQKLTLDRYPTRKKSKIVKVEKMVLLLRKGRKVLVRRKKPGKVMGGLYELPTFVVSNKREKGDGWKVVVDFLTKQKIQIQKPKHLGKAAHGYTKYKAALDIWSGELVKGSLRDENFKKPKWVGARELKALPFPAVYRKIIGKYC